MSARRNAHDAHSAQRLKDQLRVFRRVREIHADPRRLDEIAFYPKHDPRQNTPEYMAVHRRLTEEQDRPCVICGVRKSTLKDRTANPYGAKQMETHHHIIEWALANAIGTDKFNARLLPNLARRHPERADYRKRFTPEQVTAWVDHDEDNLWVLCDVHHRARYLGIHEITYPIWGPVDLLRDDFEEYVRQQLSGLQTKTKVK